MSDGPIRMPFHFRTRPGGRVAAILAARRSLGADGVHATWADDDLILTVEAEDGTSTFERIVLQPSVLSALLAYVKASGRAE